MRKEDQQGMRSVQTPQPDEQIIGRAAKNPMSRSVLYTETDDILDDTDRKYTFIWITIIISQGEQQWQHRANDQQLKSVTVFPEGTG